MDWSNEEYVRLYTRETTDDYELSWEALALWHMMLRKFDRSGVMTARRGWVSVAKITRIPLDVVQRGGAELLADGRVQETIGGFFAPNYLEAQTTSKSDKVRQRESRDRRRQKAHSQVIDNTQACHVSSRAVTSGHAPSQNVTLCSALLCDTAADMSGKPDVTPIGDPPETEAEPDPGPELDLDLTPTVDAQDLDPVGPADIMAETAVFLINQAAGTRFRANNKHTQRLCRTLVRNKHTPDEVRAVVALRIHWLREPKMRKFFQPSTLLALDNFEKYLSEIEGHSATREDVKTATTPTLRRYLDDDGEEYWA